MWNMHFLLFLLDGGGEDQKWDEPSSSLHTESAPPFQCAIVNLIALLFISQLISRVYGFSPHYLFVYMTTSLIYKTVIVFSILFLFPPLFSSSVRKYIFFPKKRQMETKTQISVFQPKSNLPLLFFCGGLEKEEKDDFEKEEEEKNKSHHFPHTHQWSDIKIRTKEKQSWKLIKHNFILGCQFVDCLTESRGRERER